MAITDEELLCLTCGKSNNDGRDMIIADSPDGPDVFCEFCLIGPGGWALLDEILDDDDKREMGLNNV